MQDSGYAKKVKLDEKKAFLRFKDILNLIKRS